jgi:hypothetical protein
VLSGDGLRGGRQPCGRQGRRHGVRRPDGRGKKQAQAACRVRRSWVERLVFVRSVRISVRANPTSLNKSEALNFNVSMVQILRIWQTVPFYISGDEAKLPVLLKKNRELYSCHVLTILHF